MSITHLVRPGIQKVKPYSSARDEFSGTASVFLDANENPFPTSYNRYPDPHQRALKQKLAELKRVQPDQIFLGNGSDEAIDLLFRVFCEPGKDQVIMPEPTYGMYSVSASINLVEAVSVSLSRDFDLDVAAIERAITPASKLLFLCSPNNPSGNLLSREKIVRLLDLFPGVVVIDEAYIDFAESESWLIQLDRFPRLVVLQTFSKAWGLAGLRLGMAFASVEIIGWLNRIKPPYNINAVTQQIALQALERGTPHEQVALLNAERNQLMEKLAQLPITEKVYPSDANFILVRMANANELYHWLLEQEIVVRNRSMVKLCENCLRITVGTPAENQKLIELLNQK
jgi:histidinol-phosphate aminotransferase